MHTGKDVDTNLEMLGADTPDKNFCISFQKRGQIDVGSQLDQC